MAWTDSRVFGALLEDALEGSVSGINLASDSVKGALFTTTPTPDETVSSANSAYGAGVWAANEETDTNWPAGGIALTSPTFTRAGATGGSHVLTYDTTTDLTHASTVTLTAVFGMLHYSDTVTTPVADQGICYNYFGGSQGVSAGTFTVVYNASGIFTIAV